MVSYSSDFRQQNNQIDNQIIDEISSVKKRESEFPFILHPNQIYVAVLNGKSD